jgi:hypothetical protein
MSLVGKEAVVRLRVVLHINSDQVEEVTQELKNRELYG